jgi:hypothetical protein
MVLNNRLRRCVRHIPITPTSSVRRSGARRRNGHIAGAVQPALFHCRSEVLEERLMLAASPIINSPASASARENTPLTFSTSGNSISIIDVGATATSSEMLGLSVGNGTLTLQNTSLLTFNNGTKNTSGVLNVSGTLANLNLALDGLIYQPTSGFSGSDQLTITVIDPGDNLTRTAKVVITVDAPPVINSPATARVNENASLTFSTSNDPITVIDPYASGASDTLTLSVKKGTLKLKDPALLTFVNPPSNLNGDTDSLQVDGTLANLNTALNGLDYQPVSGYIGSDSLKISLGDPGDGLIGSAIVAITVNAPPTLTVPSPATVLKNGAVLFSPGTNNAIKFTDAAANADSDALALGVTNGTLTLGSMNGLTRIAGQYGSPDVTVTGTVANLNAALDGLVFQPNLGFTGPTASLTILIHNSIDGLVASKTVTIFISTWTDMTATSLTLQKKATGLGANFAIDFTLQLPKGDLMVQGGPSTGKTTSFANGPFTTWYEITPDSTGSYANGTWTQLASMNVARLFFSSDVLPNGDVFVYGGEYASDGPIALDSQGNSVPIGTPKSTRMYSDSAEIFTPPSLDLPHGLWTPVESDPYLSTWQFSGEENPSARMLGGDQPSEVLANGSVLVGDDFNNGTAIFTPAYINGSTVAVDGGGSWKQGPDLRRGETSDEESWVKLGNGDILTYDNHSSAEGHGEAEIYDPNAGTGGIGEWFNANNGNLPILTNSASGYELGPALLLPDGNAFFAGPTGVIAYFHPGTTATNGYWTQGSTLPTYLKSVLVGTTVETESVPLAMDDAPGAVMPNGDLLLALSPADYSGSAGTLTDPGPTYIYELNPTTHVFTDVTPPKGILNQASNSYVDSMLVLPNGQVLLSNEGPELAFYTLPAVDGPQQSWRPTITSFTENQDGTFTLTGTQLNGRDEGAAYGDDEQMSENYPIVQVTNLFSGKVSYATTSNWSSNWVATGTTSETVTVTVPPGNFVYLVVVIADGIASRPILHLPPFFPVVHDRVDANGNAANPSDSVQAVGIVAPSTAGVTGSFSAIVSAATNNAISLSNPVAAGSSDALTQGITTGLNSDSIVADGAPPALAPYLATTSLASQLDEEGLQWAGLSAALDVLNA